MKKWIVASVLSALWALPALAALKEGDAAPDFTLDASLAGKSFTYSLKDALVKGPVVVYFFPTAYGGGCSVQAHAFAVNHDKFTQAGATVVGVSQDNITRLNRFSADPDYCGGKVAVASDPQGQISTAFDLKATVVPEGRKDIRGELSAHARVERTTFVILPNGKIVATVGGVAPQANVDQALKVVQDLAVSKRSGKS